MAYPRPRDEPLYTGKVWQDRSACSFTNGFLKYCEFGSSSAAPVIPAAAFPKPLSLPGRGSGGENGQMHFRQSEVQEGRQSQQQGRGMEAAAGQACFWNCCPTQPGHGDGGSDLITGTCPTMTEVEVPRPAASER